MGCTAKLGWNIGATAPNATHCERVSNPHFCPFAAYCGARIERYGPDFLVTSVSAESLEWNEERVLVEGGVINGIAQKRVTCGDALDCQTKCERFARRSRDGGE